jgi:hypothetical protein
MGKIVPTAFYLAMCICVGCLEFPLLPVALLEQFPLELAGFTSFSGISCESECRTDELSASSKLHSSFHLEHFKHGLLISSKMQVVFACRHLV